MTVKTRVLRLGALLCACSLLVLSAGFAWVVVDDYSAASLVPAGVRLEDGTDLGGLTREQARALIDAELTSELMSPVTMIIGDRSFTLDPAGRLTVDVETMLDAAFAPTAAMTVATRAYRKLADRPLDVVIEPLLEVDGASVSSWVVTIASQVDSPSVDATITIVGGEVFTRHSAEGLATDRTAATDALAAALLNGTKRVVLPVSVVEPAIPDASLGKVIVVDVSRRRLYLYDNMALEKDYGVAVGAAGFSTPKGSFRIIQKRYMPTWSNPGSAWAADMPATIPPGPSNPLGTRALNLDAPGIRIHGTTKNSSIGTAASHGCMRMHRWDVEDLYERVEVGTPVLIVR